MRCVEMDAEIIPVAIKYNKEFADMFYNSRQQTFAMHVLRILTSWACVCDIYYLEPTRIRDDESPTTFANRVKAEIAHKAALVNLPFDGMVRIRILF
jgi:glycerol-3-phosphate O-acyltransferase 3/4